MSDKDDLIIAPVPSLVAVLISMERDLGRDLTEAEVIEARDNCVCIVMTPDQHRALFETRGYDDLDPEDVWQEWLAYKKEAGET